jgi:hypothetical protein
MRRAVDAESVAPFSRLGRAVALFPTLGVCAYMSPMIRIAITPAAYAAIAGSLPGNVGVERARAENGDIFVWLDHATVAKLKAMRGPGESYSDVIIRLAEATGDS